MDNTKQVEIYDTLKKIKEFQFRLLNTVKNNFELEYLILDIKKEICTNSLLFEIEKNNLLEFNNATTKTPYKLGAIFRLLLKRILGNSTAINEYFEKIDYIQDIPEIGIYCSLLDILKTSELFKNKPIYESKLKPLNISSLYLESLNNYYKEAEIKEDLREFFIDEIPAEIRNTIDFKIFKYYDFTGLIPFWANLKSYKYWIYIMFSATSGTLRTFEREIRTYISLLDYSGLTECEIITEENKTIPQYATTEEELKIILSKYRGILSEKEFKVFKYVLQNLEKSEKEVQLDLGFNVRGVLDNIALKTDLRLKGIRKLNMTN